MTPKSIPKVAPEASIGPKMRRKSAARFELKFRLVLGRFWKPKWCPKWGPKSIQNLTWASQAPPGTPKAAWRPPGSHFGPILEPFWSHYGAILGPNLEQFWNPAPSPFRRSCYLLALPLLLPWRPRFSGSAGARVSAYNFRKKAKINSDVFRNYL